METVRIINRKNPYHHKQAARDGYEIIYVGRGSALGNPITMQGEHERDEVIEAYRKWLWRQMQSNTPAMQQLTDIAQTLMSGRKVALECYCAPRRCHAEVIAKAAIWLIAQWAKPQADPLGLLVDMIKMHDWTYEMSDDHRTWRKGSAVASEIIERIKKLNNSEKQELWDRTQKYIPRKEDNGADFGIWLRKLLNHD